MIDIRRARRFAIVLMFLDDLAAFNDEGEFQQSFKEIYFHELVPKKENLSSNKGCF